MHHLVGSLQQALEAHLKLYAPQMLLGYILVKDGYRPIRLSVLEVELGRQNSPSFLINILQSDRHAVSAVPACRYYNVQLLIIHHESFDLFLYIYSEG